MVPAYRVEKGNKIYLLRMKDLFVENENTEFSEVLSHQNRMEISKSES